MDRADDRSAALSCAAPAEITLVAGSASVLQPGPEQLFQQCWKPGGGIFSLDRKVKVAFEVALMGEITKNNSRSSGRRAPA